MWTWGEDMECQEPNKIFKNTEIRSHPAPSTCPLLQNLFFFPTHPSLMRLLLLSAHSAASFCPPSPPPSLPPVSIPSVSFCLSLYEQTGRDRETVVVLAVWHYQLINPCQQLVRLSPSTPTPPSLHWGRSAGTHWPARKGLTGKTTNTCCWRDRQIERERQTDAILNMFTSPSASSSVFFHLQAVFGSRQSSLTSTSSGWG